MTDRKIKWFVPGPDGEKIPVYDDELPQEPVETVVRPKSEPYSRKLWRERNKEYLKIASRERNWRRAGIGMSFERYNEILTAQDGKCAFCGAAPKKKALCTYPTRNGGTRGCKLLCTRCLGCISWVWNHLDAVKGETGLA